MKILYKLLFFFFFLAFKMNHLIRNLNNRFLLDNLNNVFKYSSLLRFNSTKNDLKLNETTISESTQIAEITNHLNKQIEDPRASRLFAVVQVGGSQYKITTEDIIMVRNQFYPTIGDKIRLEKVLLVGGKDFTVIGKPLVDRSLVRVEATVIEKTLSQNVIIFKYKPRKDNRRMNFHKGVQTLLRINSIEITGALPEA